MIFCYSFFQLQTETERVGNIKDLFSATNQLVATLTSLNQYETNLTVAFTNPTIWGNITLTLIEGLDRNTLITK